MSPGCHDDSSEEPTPLPLEDPDSNTHRKRT